MSGFDADWLAQREPFDLAARARAPEQAFAAALAGCSPIRLADLAGGTAANFRALAPRLPGDQQWVLFDHDAALLAAAPARIAHWARARGWPVDETDDGCTVQAGAARWSLTTCRVDLARTLASVDASVFDGIVTTAFLDLVSGPWLDTFAGWLAPARRPLLATLTVDGLRAWTPSLSDDAWVAAAFDEHQRIDKGFGAAAGPQAAPALAAALRGLGATVTLARADWRIDADRAPMLHRLCAEAAQVAAAMAPEALARVAAWQAARAGAIDAGRASLVVGHLDLACAWPSPIRITSDPPATDQADRRVRRS